MSIRRKADAMKKAQQILNQYVFGGNTMKNFNIIPTDENRFEFRIGVDSTIEILESDGGCRAEVDVDRPELFTITSDGDHFCIERTDQPRLKDFLGAVMGFIKNRDVSGLKKFDQDRAFARIRIFTAAGKMNVKALNSTVLVKKDLRLLRLKSANLNLSNEGQIQDLDLKANNAAIELSLGMNASDWRIKANNSSIRLHTNGFDGAIRSGVRVMGSSKSAGSGDGLVTILANNGNVIID